MTSTRAELLDVKFGNFVAWVKANTGAHHDLLDRLGHQSLEVKVLFLRECVLPRCEAVRARKLSAVLEIGALMEKWAGVPLPPDFLNRVRERDDVRDKLFRYLELFCDILK